MAKVVGEVRTKVWGVERVSKLIEEDGEYYIEGIPIKALSKDEKEIVVLDPLGHYIASISTNLGVLFKDYYNSPVRVKLDEWDIPELLTTPREVS